MSAQKNAAIAVIDAETVEAALDYPGLIERLRLAFRTGVEAPARHHHTIVRAGEPDATLLLMPAWRASGPLGVKLVSVTPGNAARGLPSVQGLYLLFDAATGAPLALIDGPALTRRRTAAISALAADYLAPARARRLLMIGTGTLAPELIAAHTGVRAIEEVRIWGRTPQKAIALARRLAGCAARVEAVEALEPAAREADIIACATLSERPLIEGAWLKPGTHLDLVGGFRPAMREADDAAVERALLYVDSRAGALREAGDLLIPLAAGVIGQEAILGELADLVSGRAAGRQSEAEITLFKSTGTALADYAAAEGVLEYWTRRNRTP